MRSRAIIVAAILSGALVTGGWMMERGFRGGATGARGGSVDGARLFEAVMTHVERFYVDSVSHETLYRKAIDGMLHELHDPHSAYLSAERLRRLTESTSGRYGGVGIQIEPRDGWIVVIAALPGTPAEAAGVQTGDRIVDIAGKSTRGWTSEEAQKAMRGEPGSSVRFTIERPGLEAKLPFTLTRREIHRNAVQHSTVLGDGIGYVELVVFSESTAQELRDNIERLRARGMRTLVLDLRSNPGGLLDQGVTASDLFLDQGAKIVSMRGRTRDATREFLDDAPQRWPELPIVVLVDSASASASEILAGALQDHDRALLIGTTTYGKGSAQSVYHMGEGGALKLTTALWYTPSGRSINRRPSLSEDDDGDEADDEDARAARRETFRTDAGRVVYGGGGITPDVIVADSTLPETDLAFQRALGRNFAAFQDVVAQQAIALKTSRAVTAPEFVVTPGMRDDLWKRLQARGIKIDRPTFDAATPYVDRTLGYQIARYAFGPDAQFWRVLRDDRMLATALELARGARTQEDLLARAAKHPGAADDMKRP
jgi:carboxyl-terminal processing protease